MQRPNRTTLPDMALMRHFSVVLIGSGFSTASHFIPRRYHGDIYGMNYPNGLIQLLGGSCLLSPGSRAPLRTLRGYDRGTREVRR